eukprot:CCRYP_005925-RA/>CCRYP_005925-RA protein AED:0.49 eAED:0.43 QI:0/0/0/1/0/0/5/0/209
MIDAERQDGNDVNTDNLLSFTDNEDRTIPIDPMEFVLYMLDLDMVKVLPRAYADFIHSFKLPSVFPGGLHCMMNAVNVNGRKFMGPNIYITPRRFRLHFFCFAWRHALSGIDFYLKFCCQPFFNVIIYSFSPRCNGTVDSGHYCHRGYNEVVMLRQLLERYKHHSLYLLKGRLSFARKFLYGKPHDQILPFSVYTETRSTRTYKKRPVH